jgi:hypothetical protein
MSALAPKADVCEANRHVCFGPIADIRSLGWTRRHLFTAIAAGEVVSLDLLNRLLGGQHPLYARRERKLSLAWPNTDRDICQG